MKILRGRGWWIAALLAALGVALLYGGALRTPFLNDDLFFLEQARTEPLARSLTHAGPVGHFRPLSRQVHFAIMDPIADGNAGVFHAVHFVLFLAALALLLDLLLALVPLAGAIAGVFYFAILPFQHVVLAWVSCSQDLYALVGVLGAVALHRRGRVAAAVLAYLAACASKESALPLPLALLAWEVAIRGVPARAAAVRVAPYGAVGLAWGVIALLLHAPDGGALHFGPEHFVAGYAHLLLALVGIEHLPAMVQSLFSRGPAVLPFVLLAAAGLLLLPAPPRTASEPAADESPSARAILRFAVTWVVAFGIVLGPVAWSWSAYYATLAAVGGALAVGVAARRLDRWAWVPFTAAGLWWHAGSVGTRAFATSESPWVWTSHVSPFYLERAAAVTDTLSRQLRALDPTPPPGARFYFATLPANAGFQRGNGPLLRRVYRDTTLASYFYSQFSESTASGRPVRFFYWNGAALERLYAGASDPYFQVGSDLLLLDHPQGAEYAFRRGLGTGGDRMDHLYWLGWAELWLGRRDLAERAWGMFGASDDSLKWIAHLRAAHNAVTDGDTVEARRHLVKAIEFGIGRSEAHAVLGSLIVSERPKYGLLELKAAAWLNPRDWIARRDLVIGLADVRLDQAARTELERLQHDLPRWKADPGLARVASELERRSPPSSGVYVAIDERENGGRGE